MKNIKFNLIPGKKAPGRPKGKKAAGKAKETVVQPSTRAASIRTTSDDELEMTISGDESVVGARTRYAATGGPTPRTESEKGGRDSESEQGRETRSKGEKRKNKEKPKGSKRKSAKATGGGRSRPISDSSGSESAAEETGRRRKKKKQAGHKEKTPASEVESDISDSDAGIDNWEMLLEMWPVD